MAKLEPEAFPSARAETRHFYRAFGLNICSEFALPELDDGLPGATDLTIRFARTGRPQPSVDFTFEFGVNEQYLAWRQVGGFLIRGTSEIDIERADGANDRLLAIPLLGSVIAVLLHLRGPLVLHASAVAAGNRGMIFLGDKYAGKSTTAAALVKAGHRLLTDDVVALDRDETGRLSILPGFPQIKLRQDSAQAVAIDSIIQPDIHPAIDKRLHLLTNGFSHDRIPATRVYVLERGDRPAVTALPAQEAIVALIRFSYASRFDGAAFWHRTAPTHFRHCAALAALPGVSRLVVPASLDRLDDLVQLVEQDLAGAPT